DEPVALRGVRVLVEVQARPAAVPGQPDDAVPGGGVDPVGRRVLGAGPGVGQREGEAHAPEGAERVHGESPRGVAARGRGGRPGPAGRRGRPGWPPRGRPRRGPAGCPATPCRTGRRADRARAPPPAPANRRRATAAPSGAARGTSPPGAAGPP